MIDVWIDDYERDGSDLILFVSCFGKARAHRVADAALTVDRVYVLETQFIEEVVQECDFDGGLTHDDLYVVTARVSNGATSDEVLDAEYDRVLAAIEGVLQS